jgi:hypothetical protein
VAPAPPGASDAVRDAIQRRIHIMYEGPWE